MNRVTSNQKHGAILIEAAIGLPLFLMFVLIVIWIALTAQARITLHTAIIKSARVGATRGIAADFEGRDAIPAVKNFKNGDTSLLEILTFNNTPTGVSDLSAASAFYDGMASEFVCGDFNGGCATLQDMPSEYIYTLVYLSEWLRISLGSQVRFPCSTRVVDGGTDPLPGCVECVFLHPVCGDCSPITGSTRCESRNCPINLKVTNLVTSDIGTYNLSNLPRGRVDIACQYLLPENILTPIFSLLKIIIGGDANKLLFVAAQTVPGAILIPVPRIHL